MALKVCLCHTFRKRREDPKWCTWGWCHVLRMRISGLELGHPQDRFRSWHIMAHEEILRLPKNIIFPLSGHFLGGSVVNPPIPGEHPCVTSLPRCTVAAVAAVFTPQHRCLARGGRPSHHGPGRWAWGARPRTRWPKGKEGDPGRRPGAWASGRGFHQREINHGFYMVGVGPSINGEFWWRSLWNIGNLEKANGKSLNQMEVYSL